MTTNALATVQTMSTPEVASHFVKSGFFADTREVSQAIVKIMAGQELGFGPFASMTGIYIISGRVSMAANLMATAVKRSGKYDYRVTKNSEKEVEIAFYQGKEEIGRSLFTEADARRAGTKNMDKYPKNMLFARAMSNGVRWYCPDVFASGPVYTPEELGATVNEEGEVIDAPARDVTPPAPQAPAAQPPKPNGNGNPAPADPNAPPTPEAIGKMNELLIAAEAAGLDIGKYATLPMNTTGELRAAYKQVSDDLKAALPA